MNNTSKGFTEVKLGEANTVGGLRTLLQAFVDEAPLRKEVHINPEHIVNDENGTVSIIYHFNEYGGSIILI